jgi:hypothetical protein
MSEGFLFESQDGTMKNAKELHEKVGQPSAAPTHVYDPATKRIWTAEMHGHLSAVRRDFAAGKMMVPKLNTKSLRHRKDVDNTGIRNRK